jgi:hypothetical protein
VDLHRVVAARMLPILTQQRTICSCLAHVDAWRTLVRAFAEQAEPIRALSGPTARALAKALTMAAGGLPDEQAVHQYIVYVMHSIVGEEICKHHQSISYSLLLWPCDPTSQPMAGMLMEELHSCNWHIFKECRETQVDPVLST